MFSNLRTDSEFAEFKYHGLFEGLQSTKICGPTIAYPSLSRACETRIDSRDNLQDTPRISIQSSMGNAMEHHGSNVDLSLKTIRFVWCFCASLRMGEAESLSLSSSIQGASGYCSVYIYYIYVNIYIYIILCIICIIYI